MKELHFNTVHDFNTYHGFKTLHPLVCVARFDQEEKSGGSYLSLWTLCFVSKREQRM